MKSFYDKEDYTIDDIKLLIANQAEESVYLDFKEAGALEKSEKKRADISKDVASFANSDGGIIIYGLKENNHKAAEISFINGNEFTKEWLEQVISSSIQRHISGIKIFPIRENGYLDKTVYVVKIPLSYDAPHLSKDNRYYKRYNFMSVPMEEYEVRQTYGRRDVSELIYNGYRMEIEIKKDLVKLSFDFFIANIGKSVDTTYKLNVYIKDVIHPNVGFSSTAKNVNYTGLQDKFKISAIGIDPIFPDETISICRFSISFPAATAMSVCGRMKIEVKTFYTGGKETKELDLSGLWEKIKTKFNETGYDWMGESIV